MGYCGNPATKDFVKECTPALKSDIIETFIETECKGKSTCASPLSVKKMMNPTRETLVAEGKPIPAEYTGVPENCWNDESIIYIQYECE